MAAITYLKLSEMPGHSTSGVKGDRMTCTFEARVDEPMPGALVMQLAQELVGGPLPGPNNDDGTPVNEVPNPGDRFLWTSGQGIISDVYADGDAGITAFLADGTLSGSRYYDQGILALDFESTPLPESCNREWILTCGYRPPEPGQNERRVQVSQILAGRNGVDPPSVSNSIPFTGAVFDASVERWIEQRPISIPTTRAYAVNGLNNGIVANTLSQMVLPNGEQFPPLEVELMRDVLVIARNVESETFASELNATFENTMNREALQLGTRTLPPYTVHYESTRTGRPISRNNNSYFRAETRLVLHSSPKVISRQSIGTFYVRDGERFKLNDDQGEPLPFVPLTATGDLAKPDGSDIHVQRYSQQRAADYSQFAYSKA